MSRVVISGVGAVSPLGNSFAEVSESLRRSRCAVRLIEGRDAGLAKDVAALCAFDATQHFTRSERGILDPVAQYAVVAAQAAWSDARLDPPEGRTAQDVGLYIGTGFGGSITVEAAYVAMLMQDEAPKPFTLLTAMNNAPAAQVSIRLGIKGPSYTYCVACASSAISIGEAYRAIRSGMVKAAVAGGCEASLTLGVMRSWRSLRVLAPVDRLDPTKSCKPFSKARAGLVLGEGAVMFYMEDLSSAVARGAPIYAEVIGYGSMSDAAHIATPDPDGQARTIAAALDDAGVAPAEVDYINAHGTATYTGDQAEVETLHRVFGDAAARIPVSSTKSAHGHLIGAAGAMEALATVCAIRGKFIPATLHLDAPEPAFELDIVANVARANAKVDIALSNSFAFGGSNAALVFRSV